uniref:Uncharacterized protein n=1 Tax=Romanomermis culicivorax TaxID=13658 RepID=A0A915L5W0_ROMCU
MPGTWVEDSFYYFISKEKDNSSIYSCLREYNNDYKLTECPTSNWYTPTMVDDSFKF